MTMATRHLVMVLALYATDVQADIFSIGSYTMRSVEQELPRSVPTMRASQPFAWPSCGHPRSGWYRFRLERDRDPRQRRLVLKHAVTGLTWRISENGPATLLDLSAVPPAPTRIAIERLRGTFAEDLGSRRLDHLMTVDKRPNFGGMRMHYRVIGTELNFSTNQWVKYCEDSFSGPTLER